jgi:hypothetical protein
MYAIMNRSAMRMKSFNDHQCDFSFDFAWQQDKSFLVLHSDSSVCSSPHIWDIV